MTLRGVIGVILKGRTEPLAVQRDGNTACWDWKTDHGFVAYEKAICWLQAHHPAIAKSLRRKGYL